MSDDDADVRVGISPAEFAALRPVLEQHGDGRAPVGHGAHLLELLADAQDQAREKHGRRLTARERNAAQAFRADTSRDLHRHIKHVAARVRNADTTDVSFELVLDLLITSSKVAGACAAASDETIAAVITALKAEERSLRAEGMKAYRQWTRGEASPHDAAWIANQTRSYGHDEHHHAHLLYGTGRHALRPERASVGCDQRRPAAATGARARSSRRRPRSSRAGPRGSDDSGPGEPGPLLEAVAA